VSEEREGERECKTPRRIWVARARAKNEGTHSLRHHEGQSVPPPPPENADPLACAVPPTTLTSMAYSPRSAKSVRPLRTERRVGSVRDGAEVP
jgi:hypothetical protein